MIALLVALAGGVGAVTRFVVDAEVARRTRGLPFPLGTQVINVTGSLLLGFITGWWSFHGADPAIRQALGTGFLGGYTTFSTACVEASGLARGGRGWAAAAYAMVMLLLSVAAAAGGFWLASL